MAKHFQYVGLSGEQSYLLSQVLSQSIKTRIMSGRDVNDRDAKPLQVAYARQKLRRGRLPIRNWTLSGNTLAALGPMHGQGGQIVVGFTNAKAAQVAAINNANVPMYGVSPSDRQNVLNALRRVQSQLVRIAA